MKARKNPTLLQLFNRLRRQPPRSDRDPRCENDAYWVLRLQGHPHSYAKRVFRDALPIVKEFTVQAADDDTEDLLFEVGSVIKEVEVTLRPRLTEEVISSLQPRLSEYTVWHEDLTGFGLRVRVSGYKSFILLYRSRNSGKLRKLTIGNAGCVPYETAFDIARQLLSEARMSCDLVKLSKRIASKEELLEKLDVLDNFPLVTPHY